MLVLSQKSHNCFGRSSGAKFRKMDDKIVAVSHARQDRNGLIECRHCGLFVIESFCLSPDNAPGISHFRTMDRNLLVQHLKWIWLWLRRRRMRFWKCRFLSY